MESIVFKKVSKVYGEGRSKVTANKNINFEIKKGELVVITGPSGAGKSTVLNLLGGMDTPTEGEISVYGQDISRLNNKELTIYRKEKIGFVFQFYNLIPNLTALENVQMGAAISERKDQSEKYIRAVGLEDRKNSFPSMLSGGEQQRVSIARALVKNPSILLCDEPTGALDSENGINILKLLKKQNKISETTVIIITHNESISKIADRIIKIKNGEVSEIYCQDSPSSVEEIVW